MAQLSTIAGNAAEAGDCNTSPLFRDKDTITYYDDFVKEEKIMQKQTAVWTALATAAFEAIWEGRFEKRNEVEQNPFADSRFCCNGGGYFQPRYDIAIGDIVVASINDTSCGDFGDRFSVDFLGAIGCVDYVGNDYVYADELAEEFMLWLRNATI